MRLSSLQRHLILLCLDRGGTCRRSVLDAMYIDEHGGATKKTAQNVVAKALENLIDKECMIGEAIRTPHKWYIKSVRLTPIGRKLAKELRGKQLSMKLR